ncbi:MAG: DUF935 family protein [Candidatus Sumerlaeota bacterium]|nr:DUF935 family protein [Candidatus Sumerlaeota bacterium]
MDVISGQLIRWIVDFNFGPLVAAPQWTIDTSKDENLSEQADIDKRLVALGVPLSAEYFYQRYGRPAPAPGERALSFDDRNLYQYHLQYGVLTINEVRAALGLPRVSWGDSPTHSPADRPKDGAQRDLPVIQGQVAAEKQAETEVKEMGK